MSSQKRQLILGKALEVFQEHGYRRVNMKGIAQALNISRPGLYLHFKTKEEIFCAVVTEFGARAVKRARENALKCTTVQEKLRAAFEAYVVDIFSLTLTSPEAKEIAESSFEFAGDAIDESFQNFEELVVAILREHRSKIRLSDGISIERCANLLVSATRGFKIVAKRQSDLRKMIHDLLAMTLGTST